MATAFARRTFHRVIWQRNQLLLNHPRASYQLKQVSAFSNNEDAKLDTNKEVNRPCPSSIISGVTAEDVANDAKLAAFIEANFPVEDDSKNGGSRGIKMPADELKNLWGLTDDQLAQFASTQEDEDDDGIPEYDRTKIDLGLGTPEQQALNIRVLKTYIRQEDGTNACKRIRWQKLIPGVLYGKRDFGKVLLKTRWPDLQRELDRYHRHFESRVYDLTVYEDEDDMEGTVHRVLPRNVQRHPFMGKLYCANFLKYHAGRPIKIPIVYVNEEESPALKRDGHIVPINKFVECLVEDGVAIPEKLELDCTGALVKDVLRLDRIEFPDGVRHSDRVNSEKFIVGPVFGGGRDAAVEDATDTE